HVFRKLLFEVTTEFFWRRRLRICWDDVSRQTRLPILVRRDHGFTDIGMRGQNRFDFSEFDAIAAQLDLLIDPAQKLEIAVLAVSHQISCAIETIKRAVMKWIGDKFLCRELLLVQVATRQPG